MRPVMFVSFMELERSDNLYALWVAYDGPKEFVRKDSNDGLHAIRKADYHGFGAIVSDDYLPFIERKSHVRTILIGHHITGGKAYGVDWQKYDRLDSRALEQIDCFVSPSNGSRDIIAAHSRIDPSKCLALGCPRTDAYFGKAKGDGRTGYGDTTMYLYAPTYRSTNRNRIPRTDWSLVDSMLEDGETLVVKRHPFTKRPILGKRRHRHVVEVSCDEQSAGYVLDCDAIVTDYSSIIFDGYLCGKPSVLYCPDKDEYLSDRPMYHPYPDFYSSKSCMTGSELVSLVRQAVRDGMGPVENECMRFTADMCDGHAVERVLHLVREAVE